jgi:hypothetical protein
MNITDKTQLQLNLDNLEKRVSKATQALQNAANTLNVAYDAVWGLPEDELLECLQELVNTNKFEQIFGIHENAATSINALLDAVGAAGVRAKVGAARAYTITDGVVALESFFIEDWNNNQLIE